jgi:hypothetical protein
MKFSELAALDVGNVIEAGMLMPGITKEKMAHKVIAKNTDQGDEFVTVESYFLDIVVVRLKGEPAMDDSVTWSQVK